MGRWVWVELGALHWSTIYIYIYIYIIYIYNIWPAPAPVSVSMLEARDLGHKVAAQIECGTCERVIFPCQVLEVLERRNWLHECIADWCWLSYLLYMHITSTETVTQPHSHTHIFSLVSVYCNMVWFNILSCLFVLPFVCTRWCLLVQSWIDSSQLSHELLIDTEGDLFEESRHIKAVNFP